MVTAVGFDNLQKLAEILKVPAAYLPAEISAMADAILTLSSVSKMQRADFAQQINALGHADKER